MSQEVCVDDSDEVALRLSARALQVARHPLRITHDAVSSMQNVSKSETTDLMRARYTIDEHHRAIYKVNTCG